MDYIDSDDDLLPPAAFISRPNSHPVTSFENISTDKYYHKSRLQSDSDCNFEATPQSGQSRLRDIIADQASEISRLKKVNAKLTEDIQQKIACVQHELQDKNMEIISERDAIQRHLEDMNKEHLLRHQEIQRDRDEMEKSYQQCIAQLQKELDRLVSENSTTVSQLEHELEVKQSEIKSFSSQLSQLRRLLSEMDSAGGWEQLHSTQISTQNQLTQTIKDLETQLKAAQELIDIDLECKVKGSHEKPLDAWRRAVLKLLIQREAQTFTFKKTIALKDDVLNVTKSELNTSLMEISNLKEKVVMLNAQINIERKRSKDLKDRKQQSDANVTKLTSQLEGQESSLRTVIAKCSALMSRMSLSEGEMAEACARLRQMEHRVESLTSRLPLIRAQFTRAISKSRVLQDPQMEDINFQENSAKEKIEELQENLTFCRSELEKAHSERNQLIYQLEEENKSFQSRVEKAREAVGDEMNLLRSTVKSLESRLDQVQEQLYSREDELSEVQRERDDLKVNQTETISQLEESLRKSKRDYAEAMLSLRQIERQSESEKEASREKIRRLEDNHEDIVCQLNQEINKLQAECNIMRTSLRQEGLLTAHRFQPSLPIVTNESKYLPPPNEPENALSNYVTQQEKSFHSNQTSDDSNLSAVIQEVTELAQALSQSEDEL